MNDFIVTFKNSKTNETYVLDEKVSRVKDKILFRELLTNHPIDDDSLVKPVFETEKELVRIKVHVANVGSFYYDFSKETIDEKREELIKEISALKEIQDSEEKVTKLLVTVDKYEPLYVLFDDEDKEAFDYEKFTAIYQQNALISPLLAFYKNDLRKPKKVHAPKVYEEKPVKVKKPKIEKPKVEKVQKPKKVKEPKVKKEKGEPKFIPSLKKACFAIGHFFKVIGVYIAYFFKTVGIYIAYFFKKLGLAIARFFKIVWIKIVNAWYVFITWFEWKNDFIFYFIFTALFSFSLLAGIVWSLNKDGLAAFFFVMTALFIVTCVYATYVQRKDTKDWKVTIQNELTPNLILFLGLAGGTVASFFTSKSIIKLEEGQTLDFMLALWITIGACVFLQILLIFTPFIIHKIMLNKHPKKEQKEPAKTEQNKEIAGENKEQENDEKNS